MISILCFDDKQTINKGTICQLIVFMRI